jgi:hypothetical protein
MRRILFTLMLGGALFALAPATALAAKHHSHSHHARHHARHHSRVRFERFGSAAQGQTSGTQSGQGNDQNAGTIASFQNGTLTITTSNGPVSGMVTPNTEIECEASDTSSNMQRDDHGDRGETNGNGNDNGNDNGDDNDNAQQNCSMADLQPGTVVREAELKISGAGSIWDKVDLITSQAGNNDNDNDNDNDNEGGDS